VQQHDFEDLHELIVVLQSIDSEEHYNKDESEVWPLVQNAVDALMKMGTAATPGLCPLIEKDFTWSCYYALRVLHVTKDPQAVPDLIRLLCRETDDTLASEEAMLTLQDIGDPAVDQLTQEISIQFHHQHYNSYLVSALTGITGQAVYDFMVNTLKDYLQNTGRYHGWFMPADFTYNFSKQHQTAALPLLKQLLTVKSLESHERHEIAETIAILENPVLYEQRLRQTIDEILDQPAKTKA
jgi:hypothetical protein